MSAGPTRRKVAAIAMAGSLALIAPLETAQAHRFNADGTTSIRYTRRGAFRGRIRSPKKFCKKNRRVVIKRKRPGADKNVGETRSGGRGRWKVPKPNARNGRYYADVKRKRRKRHRHSHRCKPFTSRTIRIRNGRQVN